MNKNLLAALPLLSTALLAQGVPEAAEPNDTTSTATVLPLGLQGHGDITAGDEDWYRITLTSASDLKVWAGPGFAGQIGDTRVRIFAADGTTVLIDVDDGSTTSHGYYSTFTVGNYAAGDYYVAVRGYDAATTGSYTIDVVAAPTGTYAAVLPPLSPVAEAAENNDPRPTFGSGVATLSAVFTRNLGNIIAGGSSGTGATTAGKDYDFYEFTVTATGVHTFSTLQTGSAPTPVLDDSVIRLFDAAFTSLAFNDDSGGSYSFLSYDITTPGTYYLCVSGYYGTSAGNYYLDIAGPTVPLPTGPSTTTVQTGGCGPAFGNRVAAGFSSAQPERCVLGTQFWLDATGLQPNAPMFRVIGLLPLASPFDLGPLGAPGCQVEVDPIDNSVGIADGTGVYFWNLDLPFSLDFVGLPLEQQIVALDPAANAAGLVASNRVSSICGISH